MIRLSSLFFVLLLSLPLALLSCVPPSLGDDDDSGQGDDDDSVVGDDDDATPEGDDDTGDDDTGDDDDVVDLVTIVGGYPAPGSVDVFVGTVLWVDFSGPTEAAPSLATAAGTPVSGQMTWSSATRMVFTPDSSLEFSTSYTASVTWTDGSDSMEFSTSDVGSAPVDVDMTGSTYAWDMGTGAVVSPQGGEALLGGGGDFTLLTGIMGQHPGHLDLIGSLADTEGATPAQDLCVATAELSEAWAGDDDDSAGDDDDSAPAPSGGNWNDPNFSAGPANLLQRVPNPLTGAEMELTLYDSVFGGTFVASSTGSVPPAIVGGTFSAHIDMRDTGMGFPCSQMSAFLEGLTCLSCPHDPGAEECVLVWIVDVTADLVPGLTMVPRSQAEIDADTTCD